jgi:hypothetical protein
MRGHKPGLLAVMFSAGISFLPLTTFAQIDLPRDKYGHIHYEVIEDMLEISGTTCEEKAPWWDDIFEHSTGCFSIDTVRTWNCDNPARHGVRSLFFYILLQVTFEPDCQDIAWFWIKDSPYYPRVGIKNGAEIYDIGVSISDICTTRVNYRLPRSSTFIDEDEEIVFYAELKSDVCSGNFPLQITGWVDGCNEFVPYVELYRYHSDDCHALYHSQREVVRFYYDNCDPGPMAFWVAYNKKASYGTLVGKAEFEINELLFADNFTTFGNWAPHAFVCCAPDTFLTFGADVDLDPSDWPTDCQGFYAAIGGYVGDSLYITTADTIREPGHLVTQPAASTYPIQTPYHYEDITFDWKVKVNTGPWNRWRPAQPASEVIRVYHGFRADTVQVTNPMPDSIMIGDTIHVTAWTRPYLSQQERVRYDWRVHPPGFGHYALGTGRPLMYRFNHFIPDSTGICQLYFIAIDTVSGFGATSEYKLVGKPRIEITMPPDSAKFCFTADSVGVLACTAAAVVNPPWLANSLQWIITPIVGSSLTTIPDPPRGDSVIFMFTNLPDSNNQFGVKYLKASLVGYDARDSVMVESFFGEIADNHPVPPWAPNWYYYWRQVDTLESQNAIYDNPLPCDTMPGLLGFRYDAFDQFVHICAISHTWDLRVECDPQDTMWGIDCFANVLIHEQTHLEYDRDWYWVRPDGTPGPYSPDSTDDPDRDGIPDAEEDSLGYTPGVRDSDGDGRRDVEDLCGKAECTWIKGTADQYDWAIPGHQY